MISAAMIRCHQDTRTQVCSVCFATHLFKKLGSKTGLLSNLQGLFCKRAIQKQGCLSNFVSVPQEPYKNRALEETQLFSFFSGVEKPQLNHWTKWAVSTPVAIDRLGPKRLSRPFPIQFIQQCKVPATQVNTVEWRKRGPSSERESGVERDCTASTIVLVAPPTRQTILNLHFDFGIQKQNTPTDKTPGNAKS